jgi:DNA-directed RNA polymerase subunit beta'
MVFADMAKSSTRWSRRVVTLHAKIKARCRDRRREDGKPQRREDRETTPGRMLLLARSCRRPKCRSTGQQPADQEGHLQDDRHRLPPLRPEGDGDLRRPHHGARLPHACRAGISFGKDDMVIPDAKEDGRSTDRSARSRSTSSSTGRPDHPGREVQQGRRRLVAQVQRQGRRGDDGRASRP